MKPAAAIVLLASGCSSIFGLDKPVLVDAADGDGDVPDDSQEPDAAIDAMPDAAAPMAVCPASYTMTIGTSRYRRLPNNLEWLPAAQACAGDKLAGSTKYTHLVVLANSNEGLSLAQMLGIGQVWLGLSDRTTEGTYRWVTAEPVGNYPPASGAPWANGEPDNALGQDCVSVQNAQMQDANCAGTAAVICECDDYPDDPARYAP